MTNHDPKLQPVAKPVRGSKGGKGSRTPKETTNNLLSRATVRFIDLIGEGPNVGLVDGYKSIYIDGTPYQNANGSFNFKGVTVEERLGTVDQAPLTGISGAENEVMLGIKLEKELGPITRTISTPNITALRLKVMVPSLMRTITSGDKAGDIVKSSVSFRIEFREQGGVWITVGGGDLTIEGKTNSPYERAYQVALPGDGPWDVRMRRVTADNTTTTTQNDIYWSGYTEITGQKFTYPYCHIFGVTADTELFGTSVPERIYHVKGRIVEVPSNYNAATRTFSGFWDGTFKWAWTDCPTWCYRDLMRNPRYGLGRTMKAQFIDDATLYRLTSYCDELVSDGKGGMEHRFSINVCIREQYEAYDLINKMASVFRGMTYWSAGNVTLSQDAPGDPELLVTNANVVGGSFSRSGTSLRARANAVMVSYQDPTMLGVQSIEIEQDDQSIVRYGYRPKQVDAFGCQSRGQAKRLARWLLYTEQYQTETITYRAGDDHAWVVPGTVLSVIDNDHIGTRWAGRTAGYSATHVTLDSLTGVSLSSLVGQFFLFVDNNGQVQSRTITNAIPSGIDANIPGLMAPPDQVATHLDFDAQRYAEADGSTLSGVRLTLLTPLPDNLPPDFVWAIRTADHKPETFRVLRKSEVEPGLYEVTALNYIADKYFDVESGLVFDTPLPPIRINEPPKPPINASIRIGYRENPGGAATIYPLMSWTHPVGGSASQGYIVETKLNDGNWEAAGQTDGSSLVTYAMLIQHGDQLQFRVRTYTETNLFSDWAYSDIETVVGRVLPALPVTDFSATGTELGINLRWNLPAEVGFKHVAIYRGTSDNVNAAVFRGTTTDTTFNDTTVVIGTQYYYWVMVQLQDVAVPPSPMTGPVSTARLPISAVGQDILDDIAEARAEAEAAGQAATNALAKANQLELEAGNGYIFRSVGATGVANIKLLEWDDVDGTGSAIVLNGDNVLAPGTVSTSKLVVTNLSGNLIDDPMFSRGDFRGWASHTPNLVIGTKNPASPDPMYSQAPSKHFVVAPANASQPWELTYRPLDVVEDDVLVTTLRFAGSGQTPAATIKINMTFYRADGSVVNSSWRASWYEYEPGWWFWESLPTYVPDGAVKMVLSITRYLDDPVEEPQAGAMAFSELVLINTFNGTTVIYPNSITTELLTVGAVTAEKIDVVDLSAISANLGSIVVESANIGELSVDTIHIADGAITSVFNLYQVLNFNSPASDTVETIYRTGHHRYEATGAGFINHGSMKFIAYHWRTYGWRVPDFVQVAFAFQCDVDRQGSSSTTLRRIVTDITVVVKINGVVRQVESNLIMDEYVVNGKAEQHVESQRQGWVNLTRANLNFNTGDEIRVEFYQHKYRSGGTQAHSVAINWLETHFWEVFK